MAATIRIKRSTGVAAPSTLKTGELAYSYGTGGYLNLGDRLFFGKGDDGAGNASSVVVIGGEYFSNMLDHQPGVSTALSALITDSANKLNLINIDDVEINGNAISTTVTNRDLVLSPNGSGSINVNVSKIINVSDPTSAQDAATKNYVDTVAGAKFITINGDTGTDTVNLSDSAVTFVGGTGLTTTVTDNTVTFIIDSTGVAAGSYGSSTAIPVLTINAQGQVTVATTASIASTLNLKGDGFSDGVVSLLDSSLTIVGGEGIDVSVAGTTFTISGEDATTTNKGIASFNSASFEVTSGAVSVKTEGITATQLANTLDLSGKSVTLANGEISNSELANSTIRINGSTVSLGDSATISTSVIPEGSNLYYTTARADSDAKNAVSGGTGVTYDPVTGVISIGQPVGITDSAVFGALQISGNVVIGGNLQVNGTETIVNVQTLEVTDNMIYLNAGESSGSPTQFIDVGFAANVNETGSYQHVGFFRDATDGRWKIFEGYIPEPDDGPQINTADPSFAFADLQIDTLYGRYAGFDSDFDVRLATKTTTDLAEGSNLYYTTARADSDFDVRLTTKTTDNLLEGSTNLYFTNERVDDRLFGLLSAGEGIDLAYNDSADTLLISAELATITNPGVASFDSDQFTVTAGAVSIIAIDGGTY